MRKRWLLRGATAVALAAALVLGARSAPSIKNSAAASGAAAQTGVIQGSQITVKPSALYHPDFQATPPVQSAAQKQAVHAQMARSAAANAARTQGSATAKYPIPGPTAGTETSVGSAAAPPNVNTAFSIFRNSGLAVPVTATTASSQINEPSHSTAGRLMFYTGNWYAARSVNGGGSWLFQDPSADFPSFCCDQDVVYDRARDTFIWERQGIYGTPAGQNLIKLGASRNGGATWCTYTLQPTSFSAGYTNQWFDYPHLATSNNYLYATYNMFTAGGAFLRHIAMRLPLDEMSNCAAVSVNFWTQTAGWSWTPVQGATDTMYLGDQISAAGTYRVYKQPEANTALTFVDRAVPAWTFTNGNMVCTVPSGVNPCARGDQRTLVGWVSHKTTGNTIGFAFNVAQGGAFPKPYTNVFLFNESDQSYNSRPYIWSSSLAWVYFSAAPNARGDIGGSSIYVPTGAYPRDGLLVRDDFSPTAWSAYAAASSNTWFTGSSGNNMGDYTRTRTFYPAQTIWTSSNYIGITGASGPVMVPKYFVFGRTRETNAWIRWRAS
jgi:hypothetical protein